MSDKFAAFRSSSVAPVRERGLKFCLLKADFLDCMVAPVRERGLKLILSMTITKTLCGRSREGAWIEILFKEKGNTKHCGRSREGAWIEI